MALSNYFIDSPNNSSGSVGASTALLICLFPFTKINLACPSVISSLGAVGPRFEGIILIATVSDPKLEELEEFGHWTV